MQTISAEPKSFARRVFSSRASCPFTKANNQGKIFATAETNFKHNEITHLKVS